MNVKIEVESISPGVVVIIRIVIMFILIWLTVLVEFAVALTVKFLWFIYKRNYSRILGNIFNNFIKENAIYNLKKVFDNFLRIYVDFLQKNFPSIHPKLNSLFNYALILIYYEFLDEYDQNSTPELYFVFLKNDSRNYNPLIVLEDKIKLNFELRPGNKIKFNSEDYIIEQVIMSDALILYHDYPMLDFIYYFLGKEIYLYIEKEFTLSKFDLTYK